RSASTTASSPSARAAVPVRAAPAHRGRPRDRDLRPARGGRPVPAGAAARPRIPGARAPRSASVGDMRALRAPLLSLALVAGLMITGAAPAAADDGDGPWQQGRFDASRNPVLSSGLGEIYTGEIS